MTTDVYIGEMPSIKVNNEDITRTQSVMYAEIDIQDLGDGFIYKDQAVFVRKEIYRKGEVSLICREHAWEYQEIPKVENEHYLCMDNLDKALRKQIIEVIEDQVNNMPADVIQEIIDGFNN